MASALVAGALPGRYASSHGRRTASARIAHAAGNRRHHIERALAAGVEMIEADLRWFGGATWVRHEHRLPVLPILWNNRLPASHRQGPWGFALGPLWLRLDVRRLPLAELLARVSGRAGLMLDLKSDSYSPAQAKAFVRSVIAAIEGARFEGDIGFCGSWPLLDLVRAERPGQRVHYSIDSATDWDAFAARLNGDGRAPGVSVQRDLLTADRAARLHDAGAEIIAWDIRDRADVDRASASGADAVMADDLALLRSLTGRR